ncbi:MAG: c-type cytochrome [Gemmatimonadota bacterium]|nr:MAG: c-type cytochrome [Gemmatimonadota bacterium]
MMKYALTALTLTMLGLSACGGDARAPAAGPAIPGSDGPLGAVPVPDDNPLTDAKIALGHQLFFDARLSVDGTRSCYSCHQNENGNGGADPIAIGAAGRQLTRHSPVIWNVGYMPRLYWDGRSSSLEAQARGAWGGGNMGVGADNLDAKAAEIGEIPGYTEQFAAVFGELGATAETVAQAIASYERTLVCDVTRFDRYAAGEIDALNEQEVRGMELFNGKAACVACHAPPLFSAQYGTEEGVYYNVGIGIEGRPAGEVDAGRQRVTEQDADWGAFKVPSLRNIAKSGPYFHDGSVADLEDAIRYMASGGFANRNRTPLLVDRELTDEEVSAIAAFLSSLDCGELEEPELPGS